MCFPLFHKWKEQINAGAPIILYDGFVVAWRECRKCNRKQIVTTSSMRNFPFRRVWIDVSEEVYSMLVSEESYSMLAS